MQQENGFDIRRLLAGARALQNGDFSYRVQLSDAAGPWVRETAQAMNATLEMLNRFTSEVVRITGELGAQGRLGGQAEVQGAGGTWWTMLNALNDLEERVTGQVRNLSGVCRQLRTGDLSAKVTCNGCGGEFAELSEHVNALADPLREREGAPAGT